MMANYYLPQAHLSPRDSGQAFSIGVVFPKARGSAICRDRCSEKPFFYTPERM